MAHQLTTDLDQGYETITAWHAGSTTFFLQRSDAEKPDRVQTAVVSIDPLK